jgi:hypothetical protein
MGLLDDINAQIARGDEIINRLNASLVARESQTFLSEDPYIYNPPIVSADGTWTLSQSTPNEGSLYVGRYKLIVSGDCASTTITSHNIVTPDDNVPARYLPCGGSSLMDVSTVAALSNQCVSKVEFRSKNPFTVKVKLAADCDSTPGNYRVWRHNFANGMGDFIFDWSGSFQLGKLMSGYIQGPSVDGTGSISIRRPLNPAWRIKGARCKYSRTAGGSMAMRWRPTPNSNTSAINPSISTGLVNADNVWACQNINVAPMYITGFNELWLNLVNASGATGQYIRLHEIEILYVNGYAPGGYGTDDDNLCA